MIKKKVYYQNFMKLFSDVNIANFEDYFTIQKNDSGFWFQVKIWL